MFRLGLTGGIGSGKTTVAQMLAARGAAVIDADAISRALTASHGAALPAITAQFGTFLFTASWTIIPIIVHVDISSYDFV